MITLRILLSPGRRGRVVDASGRSVPSVAPCPTCPKKHTAERTENASGES